MKNEIGRKLTSLTIMAIMFAGGMAIGVPSFMPEAVSDLSVTDGLLTVSTTTLQGPAILEIVVNDPDNSATDADVQAISVDVDGTSLEMNQATNGKWYLYVVDASMASLMDQDSTAGGMEYGHLCTTGMGFGASTTASLLIPSGTSVYVEGIEYHALELHAGGCQNIHDAPGTTDDTVGTTSRQLMSDAILTSTPSLSDPGADASNNGQRIHTFNASGYGTWPYIIAQELSDENSIDYGGDSVNVTFGNTDSESSISIANDSPADQTEVHLTITDPALNIDPTAQDMWQFSLSGSAGTPGTIFANNATSSGTNTAHTQANLGSMGCVDNCYMTATGAEATELTITSTSPVVGGTGALTTIGFKETGANTGVFESFDSNGNAEFITIDQAAGDKKSTFSYGGNTVDMIITYNDATVSMDSNGSWSPGTAITISVNDPDANRNPVSAETLSIADETVVIPTIVMGSPKTLATGKNLTSAQTSLVASTAGDPYFVIGNAAGSEKYSAVIYNTTDDSQRLRILHTAEDDGMAATTHTWINVTTGHTRADLVGLAGTVVLNYDITGPADLVSSTAIAVYVTDDGNNDTDSASGSLSLLDTGNQKAGVLSLSIGNESMDGALKSRDISAPVTWSGANHAGTNFVAVNFKMTHAAGNDLSSDADYAIAADFCNFDQNNGSLTHNCIYRLEAVETGENTGIFEGTVEYINLNNSTNSGSNDQSRGNHDGNDHNVQGLLGSTSGDALSVVLMDATSGSDSVRVVYNDTDAFQVTTKIGAQVETSTHTGIIDLDQDTYGVDDIGVITITDADLNQDSSIRDTYQNSSTTFRMSITASGSTTAQYPFSGNMTAIETGASTGVFVATFKVPNFKGADMELEYFESKDAGSSAVSYYDIATITSNTGSVSFDRSVYPTPWTAGELYDGAGTADSNTSKNGNKGSVTAWVTISDADESNDTLTTTAQTYNAGSILIKHTNSTGSVNLFTAGGKAAFDVIAGRHAAELGALSETEIGSSTYEISLTIDEVMSTATGSITVAAGDIIQVEYVDTADDAGTTSTQYDSSTFDLRTGTLTTDKDVYVMGSDMVLTITDPDLNLDSATCESYTMNIIEWDSSADSSQLLDNGFTSNPSSIEETGCDTGVFQTVTSIPVLTVGDGNPEYGESVTLTYVDVGLSGETAVAADTLDVEATFSISNFGALVELDKSLYNWTDTVYITITSPDHNNNSASEETIGTAALPIQASTRAGQMCTTASSKYFVAAETGPDTGVFTAEIGLTGYTLTTAHNNPQATSNAKTCSQSDSAGNDMQTGGQTDGISVSYEYTDGVVVVASAAILFNIAEANFDTSSASAGGSSVFTVVDPDENTSSSIVDTFTAAVYSDSDSGGFTLTLNETDEDTGVFEGTVFFTADAATSGSNLRVSEGDTVTAEYTEKTLPEPYADSDTLTVASTLTIGTAFPPLERAPAANARVVDAFGSSVAEVSVDQQVQIAADVSNGQSKDQAFAYLVQVQDENGVTVSLAWITGSLTAGQSMSPALSWTPSASGSYTATVFVWESVDNPTALSPTTSVTIDVV